MAGFCGFHGVAVVKNLLGKASRQSTSLCFRYESHGGHRAHEQARIETKATNGSGRKAALAEANKEAQTARAEGIESLAKTWDLVCAVVRDLDDSKPRPEAY